MNKLSMKGITKTFPGVKALSNVDFEVSNGEIRGLIGANGAGKSTLMKILAGVYPEYEGEIYINDEKVNITCPLSAINHGIVIVYQEVDTALVPYLTVAENIMMHSIINENKGAFINWKKIRCEAKKAAELVGLDTDINRLVRDLTLSEKQMVLIGRAVYQNAKHLILDEPTAPLSVQETERLFKIVKRIKDEGMNVIFISHRLDEIFQICERITVLRDGQLVGTYDADSLTIPQTVEKMLGRKIQNAYPDIETSKGDVVFEVKNLSGSGGINNVNLEIRAGEIVGLAGLVGGGKTELCKLLFGEGNVTEGAILLKGKAIQAKTPAQAVKSGLALVPEERRKEGIFVHEPIDTNITLPTLEKYCKGSFMQKRKIRSASTECIRKVGIKTPSERQHVSKLSGGNQQKVAIGKWLLSDADVFIFDEPTKGVDVGSKSEIYGLIKDLAGQGKAVLYATCEFDEILGLTDRVYVMYKGTTVKELTTKDTSEEELLFYSAGGGLDARQNVG
jgi:simple sugar transport system ATP-binding protein